MTLSLPSACSGDTVTAYHILTESAQSVVLVGQGEGRNPAPTPVQYLCAVTRFRLNLETLSPVSSSSLCHAMHVRRY